MSNKVKDAALAEKEIKVVHGTIFADEFRDRETGKEIGGDSGGYSKSEVDSLLALKADKIGVLPSFTTESSTNIDTFFTQNNAYGKIICLYVVGFTSPFICIFSKAWARLASFEAEHIGSSARFSGQIDPSENTFSDAFSSSSRYEKRFALKNEVVVDSSIVTLSGPNYDDETFTLDDFIKKCEDDDFVDGDDVDEEVTTIATISNLINGQTMRLRLIGVNHDVLANTDAGEVEPNGTKAKTTWQFYDMPLKNVNLGLPYEEQKEGYIRAGNTEPNMSDSTRSEVTIDTLSPSNMHGYLSANGLLQAMEVIYNSLPLKLQQAIKTVRKDCFISEIDDGDNYEMFDSTGSMIFFEGERYGSQVAAKLFCLSASEIGIIPNPSDEGNDPFPYEQEYNDSDELPVYKLEGTKYSYFHETYPYTSEEEGHYTRPCYYGNELWYYWLRTPNLLHSNGWGICYDSGHVDDDNTYGSNGVAPAFCI